MKMLTKYQVQEDNMIKLHFETTAEFEGLFKSKKIAVTDGIVNGIEDAMKRNVKSADLFQLSFGDSDMMYELSLPRSQWVNALESCLDHYHELQMADEAIDCWKLLEAAKVW